MARERPTELQVVEEIVRQTMPSLTETQRAIVKRGKSQVEQTGQERVVAELDFYGYNPTEISRLLGVSDDVVFNYMDTARYKALKCLVEQELLAKLGDALYKMAEIGAAEAMRGKLQLMRKLATGTTNKALLNKMYTEMLELWAKLRPGAGLGNDTIVTETWKKIQKKKKADGSVEILTQEITGRSDGAEPLRSGPPARTEPVSSLPGGEERSE